MKRKLPVIVSIAKGTPEQKAEYKATDPVYPMYGIATVKRRETKETASVVIEDLRGTWSRPDPVYEAIAPDGYIFEIEWLHSMLGHDLADIKERLAYAFPVRCDCEECAEYWENRK